MKKNTASQFVAFQAVSTTDGSAVTSGTPAVYYTIDGGTEGTGSGAITHEGHGTWSYACAQAETNGNHVVFTFVLTGAVSQTVNVYPTASVDQTGDTYALAAGATGFTAIDTVVDSIKAKTDSLTFTVAGVVDSNLTHVGGSAASGVATVDANVTTIANGAITAAAIATGAIDADALAADAGTEIGAAVKTAIEAAGSHLTLILEDTGTTLPATLDTIDNFLDTEIAAILADTDELQKAITDGGRTDLLIDAIKAKTDLMLDAAAIRTAVGLASANLDTQIATLATAANLATLDTLVDKMAPLLIGTVTGAGTATEVYVYDGVTATVTADADGNVSAVVFS